VSLMVFWVVLYTVLGVYGLAEIQVVRTWVPSHLAQFAQLKFGSAAVGPRREAYWSYRVANSTTACCTMMYHCSGVRSV
jgi:hypothetical protein